MGEIQKNYNIIMENIYKAAAKVNRDPNEITLMAVSKNQNVRNMMLAFQAGISVFGENRANEFKDKKEFMPADVIWHFIGHLQKNNVKHIINDVSMVHSVDSIDIARELDMQAKKRNICMPILMQINSGDEESKFGFSLSESLDKARELATFENISLTGLMSVTPYVKNPEENRIHYRNLKEQSLKIQEALEDAVKMEHLSMGTSGDYQVAVEEGATIVRIGTGLFGKRQYA